MDAARKFVDKGQIDKAIKEYLRVVKEDPKDVRVWLKIGDLYAKQGAKQEASETYLKVARYYEEQGFAQKAVAVYKQILKLDPHLVDVNLKLAELYRTAGLHNDAMQHFEAVAAHFHREGNTKEALATVRRVVDLDPQNVATRIKLAELYSKENMVQDAVTEFTVACDQLRKQNRADDFIKVAERLLWHKPDLHTLNRELAALYLQRNDARRALQKLQSSFKADPRDIDTLALLAQAFLALDQKSKSVSVLKELAKIHVETKLRERAAEVYRKILELTPNDADALQFFGRASAPAMAAPAAAPAYAAPQYGGAAPLAAPARASAPVHSAPPQAQRYYDDGIPTPSALAATRSATPLPVAPPKPKFTISGAMPTVDPRSRMTGAMPLVDARNNITSGLDLNDVEYSDVDEVDYSTELRDGSDVRGYNAHDAQTEQHAEVIAKILAETDVYVKYGLHQKAIDHLRKIFALDENHVEAHERLKDIYLSQGRDADAQNELLRLANAVVGYDPRRAEDYLRELLGYNATHNAALEFARRHRINVQARYEQVVGGDIALSVSDDDFINAPGRDHGMRRDSVDDFDPHELIGGAHGSPAPGRPPAPPRSPEGQHDYELDLDAGLAEARQGGTDYGDLAEEGYAYGDQYQAGEFEFESDAVAEEPELAMAVDDQLAEAELVDDIGREVAAEMRNYGATDEFGESDLPFDANEAREFDEGVRRARHGLAAAGGYQREAAMAVDDYQLGQLGEAPAVRGFDDDDAFAPDKATTTDAAAFSVNDTNAEMLAVGESTFTGDADVSGGASLEDELEEAEFYIGQAMFSDAADLLRGLLVRYPNHPLVAAKLGEVEGNLSGVARKISVDLGAPATEFPIDVSDVGDSAPVLPGGVRMEGLDFEDLEEFESLDAANPYPTQQNDDDDDLPNDRARPSVMLERPLDDADGATHFDLGLAYKEMGLHGDAIGEFEKALRARGREVQCRLMIGLCHREQGNPTEAVHQFKQALHSPALSDLERQSLYYELGVTYDVLRDYGESLYYLEMVLKRDPAFADAAARVERMRG